MSSMVAATLGVLGCGGPERSAAPAPLPSTQIVSEVYRAPLRIQRLLGGDGFDGAGGGLLDAGGTGRCRVEIGGEVWQPFAEPFRACSLSPGDPPLAATLLVRDGEHDGQYLLRLVAGSPILERLGDGATLAGQWGLDGSFYVLGRTSVALPEGGREILPPYPGGFVMYAPDKGTLLSRKVTAAQTSDAWPPGIYVTDRRTGQVTRVAWGADEDMAMLAARDAAGRSLSELRRHYHDVLGVEEGDNLAWAALLTWARAEDGRWTVRPVVASNAR